MNHTYHIAAVASIILVATACSKEPQLEFITEPASMQDVSTSITATGTIEPVTSVEVGTQVSGIIDKIYVDYNSVVKKGQVIAELDKTNLLSELSNAQSNLASAQSSLDYQKANYNRLKTLYDKGLIAAVDYEQARLSYQQAVQQVDIARQNVAKAQTNLGYATITAPIDGVVLSKEVEEGQTVASAMTTPTLLVLAQDLTDMRVIADVDEADIGGVAQGQHVTFTVDAYPDDIFEGTVTQVRQEATTTSNVVTYEVVISAPNPDLKLKPGLTANVTIYTSERPNVLCVPTKALKFEPDQAMLPKGDSIVQPAPGAGGRHVWVLDGRSLKPVDVTVGTSSANFTEILSGLSAGTKVVTGVQLKGGPMDEDDGDDKNPFMPGPPGRKNKEKK